MDDNDMMYLAIPMSFSQSEISFKGQSLSGIDLNKGLVKVFSTFKENSHPSDISISPSSRYMTFIRIYYTDNPYSFSENYILVVIDKKEEKDFNIDNGVYLYTWNPKTDLLAYIKGQYREGFPGFISKGVFIYDPGKNDTISIDFKGYDIAWDGSGQILYITDFFSVFRYDTGNKKLEKTKRKGIYFSSDNEYYFSMSYEGSPSLLYRASDDQPVAAVNDKLSKDWKYPNFMEWLKKDTVLVHVDYHKFIILDVKANSVIGEFQGAYVGRNKEGSKLVIHPLRDESIDFDSYQIIEINPGK